jgi:hypothetical protein
MIKLDLLPPEFRHAPPKRFKLPPFVSPKGLLVFLAALVAAELALFAILKVVLEPGFEAQQSKYLQLGPNLKGVREIKDKAAKAQQVNRQLLSWMDSGISWTLLLADISKGMEKGVWLTQLAFERRDFDAPVRVEDPSKAGAIANPAATAAVADIQNRVKSMGRGKKQAQQERRAVIVIRGRVATGEDEAAITGRFIENLKNQRAVSSLIEDLRLDEIRRTPDTEVPMFDFVISGAVKPELEKEFFNLP